MKFFLKTVNNVGLVFLFCYRMATIVTTETEVEKSSPNEAGQTSAISDPTTGSDTTNITGFNKNDKIPRTPAQQAPPVSKNSLGAISKHSTTTSAATASLFAAATNAVGAAKAAKKELHFMSAALGTSSKEHTSVVDNLNEEWRRNPASGATSSLPGSLKNFTIPKLYPSLNPNVNPNLPMNYEVEEMDDTLNQWGTDNARHPNGNPRRPLGGEMTINEEALAQNQAKADEPETEKPISNDDSNLFYPVGGRTDPIGWDQSGPTTRIQNHKRTRRSLAYLDLGAYSDGEVSERHHWTGRETGMKSLYKRRKTPNWSNSNPGDGPSSTTRKRPHPLQLADRRYQYTSTKSGGPGGNDGREPPNHHGGPPEDAAGARGSRDPGGPGDPNGHGNGNGDPPSSDPSDSDDDDHGPPPARKRNKNAATSEAWARIEMAKCIPASLCVIPSLQSVHDVGELKL